MEKDNITFNSVKSAHGTEISFGPLGIIGQVGVDEFGGVVNAVDIDWNGAELGTVNGIDLGTINTTGDLLNAIKALANANKYTA